MRSLEACIKVHDAAARAGHNAITKGIIDVVLRLCVYILRVVLVQREGGQLTDEVTATLCEEDAGFASELIHLQTSVQFVLPCRTRTSTSV
jgi:DNA replicative helicase MCM subunit Mcm2 (Cdc46/Mcm family)